MSYALTFINPKAEAFILLASFRHISTTVDIAAPRKQTLYGKAKSTLVQSRKYSHVLPCQGPLKRAKFIGVGRDFGPLDDNISHYRMVKYYEFDCGGTPSFSHLGAVDAPD